MERRSIRSIPPRIGNAVAAGVNPAARRHVLPGTASLLRLEVRTRKWRLPPRIEISRSSSHRTSHHRLAWATTGSRHHDHTQEDYGFGYYDDGAAEIDSLASLAPEYLIVLAAGNDRNQGWNGTHYHWDGFQWVQANDVPRAGLPERRYDTISWFGTRKMRCWWARWMTSRRLHGSVECGDCCRSPAGAVRRGRIKPDIVANGFCAGLDRLRLTPATSRSRNIDVCSHAAGSINLVAHEFTARFGRRPLSSTPESARGQQRRRSGCFRRAGLILMAGDCLDNRRRPSIVSRCASPVMIRRRQSNRANSRNGENDAQFRLSHVRSPTRPVYALTIADGRRSRREHLNRRRLSIRPTR
jgi:hypothetical protein